MNMTLLLVVVLVVLVLEVFKCAYMHTYVLYIHTYVCTLICCYTFVCYYTILLISSSLLKSSLRVWISSYPLQTLPEDG